MTINVTFRDGTTTVISECVSFDPSGPNNTAVVVATNDTGGTVTWWIPWDVIKFVQQEP